MKMIRYEADPPRMVQPKGCETFNPIWVQTYAARWLDGRGFGHEVVNEPVGGERENGIKCYSFTCKRFEFDHRYKDKATSSEAKMNMDQLLWHDYESYLRLLPTVLVNMFTTEIIPEAEGCVECKFYYKNKM